MSNDKVKLEQELKESEARYRNIFEKANDPMYIHDASGNILDANEAGLSALKCTKEEFIGSNISRWLTQESFLEFKGRLIKRIAGEPVEQPVVIEVICKDGEHRWAEIRTRVVYENGRVKEIHGIARDITEKRGLEEKLRKSEEKYRDLFDNASDCFYTIDLDGQFLTVNDSVVKAMKCASREEVLESNMSKWMTPESLEKAFKFMHEVITEEDYYNRSVVIEIIRKDGKHVWFEHKARPIKDNNSKIIGLHGICRDITEKIRLEQELKESEAKYRDLFENAQDAMYVLDTEGIVLKMNRVGLAILGCTKEEVIGKNISNWLTSKSNKIVEERRKKIRSGERINWTEILEIVSKSGEHRWIEIKTRRIKYMGRTIEVHGIGRDITENKILKQELNKSNNERKLLCYLIKGTRGGKTRAMILKHLTTKSYNAHQLSKALKMDYKTVRHHLNVLIKNGIINVEKSKNNNAIYFISNNVSENLNRLG